jgi:hypothetical protein
MQNAPLSRLCAGAKEIYRQESGNAFDRHESDQRCRQIATGSHDHISGRKPTWRY